MPVEFKTISASEADTRIDRWIKRIKGDVAQGHIEKALRKGQIKVNKGKVIASYRLQEGDEVRVPPLQVRVREITEKAPLSEKFLANIGKMILFEDDDIIVLNKPSGIAVQGGSNITENIDDGLKQLYETPPKLVHRIDKDTSGLLLVAKDAKAAAELTEAFRHKSIEKTYLAVILGVPDHEEGEINLALQKVKTNFGEEKVIADLSGKKSITHYKLLEPVGREMSLVELRPITGRTHQLRVHMLENGAPIAGDGKYGGKAAHIAGLSSKLHLHAYKIFLPNFRGKKREFLAPLPPHMKDTIGRYFSYKIH